MAAGVGDRRKGGEAIARESGMDMYTRLCLKRKTDKDPLYSTWNSAQRYAAAWKGGGFRGNRHL